MYVFEKDFLYNFRIVKTFNIDHDMFESNKNTFMTKYLVQSLKYYCNKYNYDPIKCLKKIMSIAKLEEMPNHKLHPFMNLLTSKLNMFEFTHKEIHNLLFTAVMSKIILIMDDKLINEHFIKQNLLTDINSPKFWLLYYLHRFENVDELISKELQIIVTQSVNQLFEQELRFIVGDFVYKDVILFMVNRFCSKYGGDVKELIASYTFSIKNLLSNRQITIDEIKKLYETGDLQRLQFKVYEILLDALSISKLNKNSFILEYHDILLHKIASVLETYITRMNNLMFGYYNDMFNLFAQHI